MKVLIVIYISIYQQVYVSVCTFRYKLVINTITTLYLQKMIVVLLLLTQFVLCWTGKPIDYTPLMRDLDDDIVQDVFILKSSTLSPETRGQMLKDNIYEYNDRLCHTRDMIEQNIYEAYIKAVELQKLGGPQFLKRKIDVEKLKTFYNWQDDDISKLQMEFETTKKNWKEVETVLEPAEERFKKIQEEDAKEKAEQAEREQKRIEKLRKIEEEFNKKVTVNLQT